MATFEQCVPTLYLYRGMWEVVFAITQGTYHQINVVYALLHIPAQGKNTSDYFVWSTFPKWALISLQVAFIE